MINDEHEHRNAFAAAALVGGIDFIDGLFGLAAGGQRQRGGQRDGRGVRTAPTKGRNAIVRRDALEPGNDRHLTLAEPADDFGAVDLGDTGRAMGTVGLQRNLPAEPGARIDAHILQRDRQEPGRHLLPARDHGVIFACIVQGARLAAPPDEFVGLAGHGGDDDGYVVARIDLAFHMPGHVPDAVEVGDGGATEFQNETGHGRS